MNQITLTYLSKLHWASIIVRGCMVFIININNGINKWDNTDPYEYKSKSKFDICTCPKVIKKINID